jgi:methyl-accepting chemotaxis protein
MSDVPATENPAPAPPAGAAPAAPAPAAPAAPPEGASEFAQNCRDLATKTQEILQEAENIAQDVDSAAKFVQKVGGFLSWCAWIPGVGTALAAAGAAVTSVSVATEDIANEVVNVAKQGISWTVDLNQLADQVQKAGSVSGAAEKEFDSYKDELEKAAGSSLTPFVEALKQALHL